ncbi:MAG: cytochrome P460 family protein [Spirochaetales bacterium]|nr:cytochrome P460 family protein [Spirochaetales bacterium]
MKIIILFVMIIIISACSKPEEQSTTALVLSEINGAVLWERISTEAEYKTYAFWPDHEDIQPGQSPHGAYHKIYINKVLSEALPSMDKVLPEGSIIVKENLDSQKSLDAITVMVKVKDYNPEAGDWFWAKYTPLGEILAEGTPVGCISCHQGMDDNDYIIVRPLDLEI